jgi:magnesium-transporting ATPase (P-type)
LEKVKRPLEKCEEKETPFLLGGTLITRGEGLALVCAVGKRTLSGKAGENLRFSDDDD